MLEEGRVHFKFAEGILLMATRLKPREVRMPIFLDGYVMECLLQHTWEKMGKEFEDHLGNCVYMSSKTEEFDRQKLVSLAREASDSGKTLRALDFRTKTGKLGQMIRDELDSADLKDGFKYMVMYDSYPGRREVADESVYLKEFPDGDRSHLHWISHEDYEGMMPRKVGGSWDYSGLDRTKIIESEVTLKIMDYIDQFLK